MAPVRNAESSAGSSFGLVSRLRRSDSSRCFFSRMRDSCLAKCSFQPPWSAQETFLISASDIGVVGFEGLMAKCLSEIITSLFYNWESEDLELSRPGEFGVLEDKDHTSGISKSFGGSSMVVLRCPDGMEVS
jgi:hypothetical protein